MDKYGTGTEFWTLTDQLRADVVRLSRHEGYELNELITRVQNSLSTPHGWYGETCENEGEPAPDS